MLSSGEQTREDNLGCVVIVTVGHAFMRGTRGKGGQESALSFVWRPLVLGRCGAPISEPAKALLGRLSLLLCSLKGSSGPWHKMHVWC